MVRDLMDDWMEFIQGNTEPIFADLRSRGYKSTLDLPVICFFDDLMIEISKNSSGLTKNLITRSLIPTNHTLSLTDYD